MSFLETLVSSTRERVERSRAQVPLAELEERAARAPRPRGFRRALQGPEVAVIGELKRATPSEGVLDADLDAAQTALAYAAGGAAAVSVLTEPQHFLGSLDDLAAAATAGLPVLRKDFILEDYQIHESRAGGADAVLLIVRLLGPRLPELVQQVRDLGMDALVEIFEESELEHALAAEADLIGVNHRDLETFEVDEQRTAKLAPLLAPDVTLVALSGVSTRADVESLASAGARAVLVGTALVRAPDPAAKVRELCGR